MLNPIAPVNSRWCEESLPFAMQRLMAALNPVELAKLNQPHMLDLLFSCYLPLIKAQLVGAAKILGNMDKMVDTIVQFCDLHVSDHQVNCMIICFYELVTVLCTLCFIKSLPYLIRSTIHNMMYFERSFVCS